jgi:hypothetical protein
MPLLGRNGKTIEWKVKGMTVFDDWGREAQRSRDRAEKFGNLPEGTRVKFVTRPGNGDPAREGSGEIIALADPDKNKRFGYARDSYRVLTQRRPGSGHLVPVPVRPREIVKVTRKATR